MITAVRYNWQKNCASKALDHGDSPANRTCWYCATALKLTAAHEMQDIDRLLEVLHGTVNKQAIAAAFGRAAAHYEQTQSYSARVLTSYWQCSHSVKHPRTGRGLWTWLDEPPLERGHAQVTALDLSPPMLVQARHKMPQTIIWREISNPCR